MRERKIERVTGAGERERDRRGDRCGREREKE